MNPVWPSRILRRAFQRDARWALYVLWLIVCFTVTSGVQAADNAAFCLEIQRLLQDHCGYSIEYIGGIDISGTL